MGVGAHECMSTDVLDSSVQSPLTASRVVCDVQVIGWGGGVGGGGGEWSVAGWGQFNGCARCG